MGTEALLARSRTDGLGSPVIRIAGAEKCRLRNFDPLQHAVDTQQIARQRLFEIGQPGKRNERDLIFIRFDHFLDE